MPVKLLVIACVAVLLGEVHCQNNPCDASNHKIFPESGSRNQRCSKRSSFCDRYLNEDWYVAPNSQLVNKCPPARSCGVTYPTWMNGSFPSVTDGIVNRTVCINQKGDCCKDAVPMQIKNCSGFYTYYFVKLKECSSAYCFESSMSCDEIPTEQPLSTTVTTELITNSSNKPKGGSDKGLLIGLVVAVVVLLAVTAVSLTCFIKSKSKHRNTVKSIETASTIHSKEHPLSSEGIKQQTPPPSYEESQRAIMA